MVRNIIFEQISSNAEQTQQIARVFSKKLSANDTVVFIGDLGAGKTTFIKSIVTALTGTAEELVVSPTFTFLQSYKEKQQVQHFDLYRIRNESDFIALGFEEYLEDKNSICLIEWPQKIQHLLPVNTYYVYLDYLEKNSRKIRIERVH